jgi:hypothetical protein
VWERKREREREREKVGRKREEEREREGEREKERESGSKQQMRKADMRVETHYYSYRNLTLFATLLRKSNILVEIKAFKES